MEEAATATKREDSQDQLFSWVLFVFYFFPRLVFSFIFLLQFSPLATLTFQLFASILVALRDFSRSLKLRFGAPMASSGYRTCSGSHIRVRCPTQRRRCLIVASILSITEQRRTLVFMTKSFQFMHKISVLLGENVLTFSGLFFRVPKSHSRVDITTAL